MQASKEINTDFKYKKEVETWNMPHTNEVGLDILKITGLWVTKEVANHLNTENIYSGSNSYYLYN